MSKLITSVVLILALTSTFAQTVATTSVGRYLSVQNKPLSIQRDLLSQTFHVRFPKSILTIGDAVQYLLNYSGYRLVIRSQQSHAVQTLLQLPLPQVDRDFGPMSLQDGLKTLAGKAYQLVIDPVHRLVSFRLKPSYQSMFTGAK